jgi:hypothetical protein
LNATADGRHSKINVGDRDSVWTGQVEHGAAVWPGEIGFNAFFAYSRL